MSDKTYTQYIKNFDINLLDCTFLGKGHNGIVYLLPDNKVIKICFKVKSCQKEYAILNKISKNKYFPQVYGMCGNYMIRDYVEGMMLNKYISTYGLSRELVIKIIRLFEEFKKLKFLKLDLRCKDIIVQPDGSLMVIDPKKFYSKKREYPRHLAKGLYHLDVLDFFMSVVKEESPQFYNAWKPKIDEYIEEKKMERGLLFCD